MTTLNPLHDYIVVLAEKAEHTTLSGIIIPDIFDKPTGVGIAIAVGPGRKNDNGERKEMTVSTGDRLLYPSLVGHKIVVDKVEHLVLKESEVFAILK